LIALADRNYAVRYESVGCTTAAHMNEHAKEIGQPILPSRSQITLTLINLEIRRWLAAAGRAYADHAPVASGDAIIRDLLDAFREPNAEKRMVKMMNVQKAHHLCGLPGWDSSFPGSP
jgi:hypothetical protein